MKILLFEFAVCIPGGIGQLAKRDSITFKGIIRLTRP